MNFVLFWGWFLLGLAIFFEKSIWIIVGLILFMLFAGIVKGNDKENNKEEKNES